MSRWSSFDDSLTVAAATQRGRLMSPTCGRLWRPDGKNAPGGWFLLPVEEFWRSMHPRHGPLTLNCVPGSRTSPPRSGNRSYLDRRRGQLLMARHPGSRTLSHGSRTTPSTFNGESTAYLASWVNKRVPTLKSRGGAVQPPTTASCQGLDACRRDPNTTAGTFNVLNLLLDTPSPRAIPPTTTAVPGRCRRHPQGHRSRGVPTNPGCGVNVTAAGPTQPGKTFGVCCGQPLLLASASTSWPARTVPNHVISSTGSGGNASPFWRQHRDGPRHR